MEPTKTTAVWPDCKIDLLKELWCKKGLTASQCARELGTTRNAVLSKVHRMGIATRNVTMIKVVGTAYRRKKKPFGTVSSTAMPGSHSSTVKRIKFHSDPLPPERVSDVPLAMRKKLADIQDDQCRWIYGDTSSADYHFCHHKQIPGIPYCPEHRGVCFNPPEVRQRQTERDVKMARAKEDELA